MLSDKVKLTAKEILEKDFKTSIKGYNKDEVDQFLDLIIKDYETFHQEIEKLQQENLRLRKQIENRILILYIYFLFRYIKGNN